MKGLYKLLGDLEFGIWATVWNLVSSECWTGFDSRILGRVKKSGKFSGSSCRGNMMGCYDEVRLQYVIGILGIFHVKSLKNIYIKKNKKRHAKNILTTTTFIIIFLKNI